MENFKPGDYVVINHETEINDAGLFSHKEVEERLICSIGLPPWQIRHVTESLNPSVGKNLFIHNYSFSFKSIHFKKYTEIANDKNQRLLQRRKDA